MACKIRNDGAPYSFRGLTLHSHVEGDDKLGRGVEVASAVAWELFDKYPDGKVDGKVRFVLLSGTPLRAALPPRKYLTRTAAHRAMRVPDAADVRLPAEVPADVRKLMAAKDWQAAIPSVLEKCDAAPLALWLALSGLTDRAEAVLAAVVVG